MDLPVYELRINENMEAIVDAIALVENPAIESDFIAFSKEQENISFSMDDENMELLGAAMIPNLKMYRKNKEGVEYYAFFTAPTIRQIAQVFSKNGFQSNLNIAHTPTPAHSYIFQNYIVDESKGMFSPKGLNLPDGSWAIGVKVTDKKVWQNIKEGKIKGFSVEGVFELFKEEFDKQDSQELEEVLQLIKEIKKYIFKTERHE